MQRLTVASVLQSALPAAAVMLLQRRPGRGSKQGWLMRCGEEDIECALTVFQGLR